MDPRLWLFATLLAAFTLLEGSASRATVVATSNVRAAPLPYLAGLALLGGFWLSLYGAGERGFAAQGLAVIGALAMSAGIALRLAAIRALRRYFTSHVALASDHRLVTGGLYAWLRHPSELGLLMVAFGASLLLDSGAGWLFAAAVLLPLSLYRIRLEDAMLCAAFGAHFRRYARTTPALLPHWRRPHE
ncbi:isoprenylcysteine carboxylmethyltransferase family protein [Microbulbifer sp. SAOS-129_SWC]|uniref:methyltransferase family protein n=1 Tax=Microbulbifer sp. SAOS-129_SWC TaxID=3145235 RepID=UPI0032166EC6